MTNDIAKRLIIESLNSLYSLTEGDEVTDDQPDETTPGEEDVSPEPEEENLEEAVKINTDRYERKYGKKPVSLPGKAEYRFTTTRFGAPKKDDVMVVDDEWFDAKDKALKWAKEKGASEVFMMEAILHETNYDFNNVTCGGKKMKVESKDADVLRKWFTSIEDPKEKEKVWGELTKNEQSFKDMLAMAKKVV